MRCLVLHCSSFSFVLKEQTAVATKDILGRSESYSNCFVIFLAAEGADDDTIINRCAKDIRKYFRKSGATMIVVNPFAHLTAQAVDPTIALNCCQLLTRRLSETLDVPVVFSSFGWIKEFSCCVQGQKTAQLWIEH
jgi:threonyl-tRNA synthetase